jgi:hypothetical protein
VTTKAATLERAPATDAGFERPYARSWVNVVTGWIDALPGPTWAAYVALSLVGLLLGNVTSWLAGTRPVGAVDPDDSSVAFWLVFPLAAIHYLDRAARVAWDRFRPVVDCSDAESDRIRYELSVTPARGAGLLGIIAVVIGIVTFATDPAAGRGTPSTVAATILTGVSAMASTAVSLVLVYRTVRQLGLVSRLHQRVSRVDLFAPEPTHAISLLTAQTGFVIVVIAAVSIGGPQSSSASIPAATAQFWQLSGFLALPIAATVFILPLRGLHDRLVDEKRRLLGAVNARFVAATAALHESVDELGPADVAAAPALQVRQVRADTLNKSIASLVQERDVLTRLSTWPWDPTTLRAFVSAILLPIVIFLATRLLGRVV